MTPATMFYGDLRVLASDAVQMAENAYKKGQTDEREACAQVCDAFESDSDTDAGAVLAAAIRARGKA
jgi:hypothetical protein